MDKSKKSYINGFDYLRVAAAFAVVWIHACDTSPLARRLAGYGAYFSVPCFLMMAAYLSQCKIESNGRIGWAGIMRLRLIRILPAFLGWTAIYLVFRFGKRLALGEELNVFNPFSILFMGGASYQLYFLPMLMYCTAIFTPVLLGIRRIPSPHRWVWGWVLGALMLLITNSYKPYHAGGDYALLDHMHWMAGFYLVGAAAAMTGPPAAASRAHRQWLGAVLIILLVGTYLLPLPGRSALLLKAIAVFSLALYLPLKPAPAGIKRMSRASYGIYLAHGIFVEGLQWILARAGLDIHSFGTVLGIIIVSFLGAYGLTEGLLRFKGTRWLAA